MRVGRLVVSVRGNLEPLLGLATQQLHRHDLSLAKAERLVRFEKLCVSGGESPPSLVVKPLEFRVKTMNGKV